MAIDLTKTAPENCPRFERCNINACPLAPNSQQVNYPNDPSQLRKEKCASKNCRMKIGLAFGLKNKGMTSREITGARKWAELPEEVKQERIRKLTKKSLFVRLKSKGYGITRVKSDNPQTTLSNSLKSPQKGMPQESSGKSGLFLEAGK